MDLSPVWPSIIAKENLLKVAEVGFVWHPTIHMYSDIDRIALIGRTEPDIIGLDETTPQWEMNLEAVLFDTILYLTQNRLRIFCRNGVLHCLSAHQTGRYIQSMAIVDPVSIWNTLC